MLMDQREWVGESVGKTSGVSFSVSLTVGLQVACFCMGVGACLFDISVYSKANVVLKIR